MRPSFNGSSGWEGTSAEKGVTAGQAVSSLPLKISSSLPLLMCEFV